MGDSTPFDTRQADYEAKQEVSAKASSLRCVGQSGQFANIKRYQQPRSFCGKTNRQTRWNAYEHLNFLS